ncbi:MAG: DUF6463 family protein [Bacteroidota bacterium]
MKNWIGKTIALIGLIHTIFGFVVLPNIFRDLLSEGLFNTVNGQLDREFFFWFIQFGLLLVLFGGFVNWVEQRLDRLPLGLGWTLLAFTALLVGIMPISGAWLMLIPAVGILIQYRKNAPSLTEDD